MGALVYFVELAVPPRGAAPPPEAVFGGGGVVAGPHVPAPVTGQSRPVSVVSRAEVGLPALLMSTAQLQARVAARSVLRRRAVGTPSVSQAGGAWVVKPRGINRRTV